MAAESIESVNTVRDAIVWAKTELEAAGVYCGHGTDNVLDEAAWLVGGVLEVSPSELEQQLDQALAAPPRLRLQALIAERIATRKPAAYLLHEAWFAGLPFYVDERVIVPRSLTAEFIQEQFAPWIDAGRVHRILDLCTGSGCMAIACALVFPQAQVDAVDLSNDALAVARINVERHRVGERVRLLCSDLFAALAGERYDVIVSNPPYVPAAELDALPPEYGFEPRLALFAEQEGLAIVLRILRQARHYLEPGGILIVEVGNSREALERALSEVPFVWLTTSSGDESVFMLSAEDLGRYFE